jgi:carboxymethylenebutenolidase
MADITIAARDGGTFGAYLAAPASGAGAAVVVIQEIFGVNRVMRDLCDGFAAQGFFALCPDMFWRLEPGVQLTDKTQEEWDQAFKFMQKFDHPTGVEDLAASIAHARALDGCTGKAGAVGYCLGGALAFAVACLTDSDASVGYYPVQVDVQMPLAEKMTKPLMFHIAENDAFCPAEAQAKIKLALGDNDLATLHFYPGVDHAFAREGGLNFDQAAAELANQRTAEFLKANLA